MEYSWVMAVAQDTQHGATVEHHQCNLVGGSGLIVQIALGLMSFTVLVYKRSIEKPPRPFKIWLLDSSKQVLSALFAHLANMIFSIFLTSTGHAGNHAPPPNLLSSPTPYIYNLYSSSYTRHWSNQWNSLMGYVPNIFSASPSYASQSDPCNYYFITVVIDTSCGVFMACFLLDQLDSLLKKRGWEQLRTGNYYRETKIHKRWKLLDEQQNEMNVPIEDTNYVEIDYVAWLLQLAIWLFITFIVKIILFFGQIMFKTPLGICSYVLLFWLNPVPIGKLIFVMIFIPTIMNGLQFWIQDNVLKKKSYSADSEEIEEEEDEHTYVKRHLEFDELYPNEEQYSAQISQAQLSQFILQHPTANDPHHHLHNVSFSKNYKDNSKLSRNASQTELHHIDMANILHAPMLLEVPYTHSVQQVTPLGVSNKVQQHQPEFTNSFLPIEGVSQINNSDIENNSKMNKGFLMSNTQTLTNTDLLNLNDPKYLNGNIKHSKFAQIKEEQKGVSSELQSKASKEGINLEVVSSNLQMGMAQTKSIINEKKSKDSK